MTPSDPLTQRIPDPELRRLALESSEEPASVFIELAVPEPQVEYATASHHDTWSASPLRVEPMGKRERAQLQKAETDARNFLEALLEEPPVYLKSARAFVVTVTGRELDQIARQAFTKRIERNRTIGGNDRPPGTGQHNA
jgi:hypothetical protein